MAGPRGGRNPSSSRNPAPGVDPQQLLEMIQGLAANQHLLAAQLHHPPPAPPPPPPPPPPQQQPPQAVPGVREFRYMRPPSFSGSEGSLAAEEFLQATETILTVSRIPPAEWASLMDVQLTDAARVWWKAEKTHLAPPILWETFTERFNRKFFPESAREELLSRFVELRQRGRSVDEYEAEFSSLSRYAPHLVADPTIRRRQFQKGLDKYLKIALSGRTFATHDAVLDAARGIESAHREPEDPHIVQSRTSLAPVRSADRPPQRQPAPQRQQFSQRQPLPSVQPYQRPGVQPQGQFSVKCSFCGFLGHTYQECRKRLRLCHSCGSPDHISTSCPRQQQPRLPPPPVRPALPAPAVPAPRGPYPPAGPLPSQQQAFQGVRRQQPQRQTFMMSAVEAEATGQVITGMIVTFILLRVIFIIFFLALHD